jgi:hypothetical protein
VGVTGILERKTIGLDVDRPSAELASHEPYGFPQQRELRNTLMCDR